MACRFPKSNYGSHNVCCANGNGRGFGLQYCTSCYMQSIHICYYNKIYADDGKVQSTLHTDITEGIYCKIVGHGHYMPHQRCGRQMMRRQCPEPPLIGSLPITYARHMCNWWMHSGAPSWYVLKPTPCFSLLFQTQIAGSSF
jgi:hypothetical protein